MKINFDLIEESVVRNYFKNNCDYKIETISARELFVPERIDLIAKLKYIEYKEKGYNISYAQELYLKTIESFSWGSYTEPTNNEKNTFQKYIETFNELIEDIKHNGFNEKKSIIPVGQNNVIINGAHRTAIAAYYNLDIPIVRFDNAIIDYGANFFQKRLLENKYINYSVLEYCKIKNNIFLACIWPKAQEATKKALAHKLIDNCCKIVYKLDVKLSYDGLKRLIIQTYAHQNWIGTFENNYKGAASKAMSVFDENEIVTFYFLECNELEKIIQLKDEIRGIYKIDKSSIHITDNAKETRDIANIVLNGNSIHFLNNGKPEYSRNYNSMLTEFKRKLIANNYSFDDFVIDSSSIMALYGIRDVSDIDFMTISKKYDILENEIFSNHHKFIEYYRTAIEDIVLNPNNFLIYNEIKFITLDVLASFKANRGETKDIEDVKLIQLYKQKKLSSRSLWCNIKNTYKRKIVYFQKRTIGKMKIIIFSLLKMMGIYEYVRKLYRTLKHREIGL